MRLRHLLIFFGLFFTFQTGYSQEICDNGVDDDGDTLIDIADPDCAEFYGLTFTSGDSDCSVPPPDAGIDFFSLAETPIKSSNNTVDDQSKVVVGDVDNDGIPDAVACTRWGFQVSVFATTNDQVDGNDEGNQKATITFGPGEPFDGGGSSYTPELEVFIADIGTFDASGNWVSDTPDKLSEIFAIGAKRVSGSDEIEDYFLIALTVPDQPFTKKKDLIPLYHVVYMGNTSPGPDVGNGSHLMRPGIPGITDFDGDGKAEIYLKNRIYAAETGFLLADGGGDWLSEINSAPVAADIIGNNEPDLICGDLIYDISSVDLASDRTPMTPAVLTPQFDLNDPSVSKLQSLGEPVWTSFHPRIHEDPFATGGPKISGNNFELLKLNFSSTSVADVNNDGDLEVFISGALDSNDGLTAVFYWNVLDNAATAYVPYDPDDGTLWKWGTGRVNLKDLDNDAKVEANFVAGDHLFALEESGDLLIEKWTADLKDALSGIVSTTVYDFENDGRPEIVVRDAKELRMHDGLTGALVNSPPACASHTWTEGPIVVDYNGDGDTDICIPCYKEAEVKKPDDEEDAKLGWITLYNSTTSNWLPTRRVWNQGPYFVVNIRDDLTVPSPMGDQSTIFGLGDCDNGQIGPQRPLNMFLNQVPTLGAGGCPIFPAPDIAFGGIDPRDPAYDPTLVPGDPGYIPPTIEVIPPVCGETQITVNFNITNTGSLVITDDIPVSFWSVDPTDPSVTPDDRLHVETLSVTDFKVGEIKQFSNIIFNGIGGDFTLYIVLNDNYASTNKASLAPFLPLTLDDPDVQECDINNNIFDFPISPRPFVVQTVSTPNVQCDASDPDEIENGTITTFIYETSTVNVPNPGLWTKTNKVDPDWENDADWSGTAPEYSTNQSAIISHNTTVTEDIKVESGDTLVIAAGVTLTTDHKIEVKDDGVLIILGSIVGTDPGKDFTVKKGTLIMNTGAAIDWAGKWDSTEDTANITIGGLVNVGDEFHNHAVITGPGNIKVGDELKNHDGEIFGCTAEDDGCCTGPTCVLEGSPQITNYNDYSYQWYYGSDTLSPIPGPQGTDRILQGDFIPPDSIGPDPGVAHGLYTLVVTNKLLGCQSLPLTDSVKLEELKPDIQLTKIQDQTICTQSGWDGRVDAEVVGGPLGAAWSYQWVDDNLTPYAGQTNKDAIGLEKGIYILEVSLDGSDCVFSSDPMVVEGPEIPEIVPITLSNITNCEFPDGAVTAEAFFAGQPFDPADTVTVYEFTWRESSINFNTDGNILDISATNPTRKGLDKPIWYAVQALHTPSGCSSVWTFAEVQNQTQLPEITMRELAPQTSCDPANPNGRIEVDITLGGVPQSPADFTINWFRGDNKINSHLNTSGVNGEIAEGVDGLVPYTVQVISASDCPADDKLQITDSKPVLAISAVTMVPNSTCNTALASSPFTGELIVDEITIDGVPTTDYTGLTFTWYEGNDILTATEIVGETASSITQRDDGDYLVLVTQDNTSCASPEELEPIAAVEDLPVILITPTPQTTCSGTPNGIMSAAVDVGGTPTTAGYTFEWFDGDDVGDPAVALQSGSENQDAIELAGTPGGRPYTVRVTNNATGCSDEFVEFLFDVSQKPVIDPITKIDNTICDAAIGFTGSVTATVTDVNGSEDFTNAAEYDINWYQGETTLPPSVPVIDPDLTTPLILEGIEGNWYTIEVVNKLLGCTSLPVKILVEDKQPTITFTFTKIPSTNCDPLNPAFANGSILAEAWADIDLDGVVDPGEDVQADFEFNWYEGNKITQLTQHGVDPNSALVENIQGGAGFTYTIEATHAPSGCVETQFPVTLGEAPLAPTFTFTTLDDSGCVVGKSTGQITTLIEFDKDQDGFLDDITNDPDYTFTYSWTGPNGYTSNTGPVIGDPTNGGQPALGPGLEDGDYNVTITEASLGCTFNPLPVTVDDAEALILYELVETPSTNCRPDGTPDGSLSIKAYYDANGNGIADNDGIEDDQSQFTFTLSRTATPVPPPVIPPFTETAPSSDEFDLDGDGTPPPGDPGDIDGVNDTFNGLQGGAGYTYEVLITHNDTGCPLVIPTPLLENPFTPAISFTPVDNAGCVTDKFTGQIITLIEFDTDGDGILDDISSSPVPADYNFQFEWKDALGNILNDDSGTPVDNYIIGDPTNIPASPLGPGLNNGTYSVTITELNSGCSFTPPDITISPGQFQILYELVATPSTNCRPDGTLDGSLSIKAYYDVNGDGLPDNDGIEDDQTQFTFALSRTATPVPPPVIPPFTETAPSSDEFDLDGDGTPPPGDPGDIDGVNDTFNGLQGGAGYTYEVLITHNDTGCPLVIPTPLLENPFTPAISFTPVDNAGCVTDKFTGQIITLIEFDTDGDGILDDISSSPVPADYNFQFEWKDALGNILNDDSGTPVDNYIIGDPTNIPASPLGPGLNNGTYSVTITELNSGCSFTPPDITISPGQFQILYELVATPSTNCRPDGTLDGSLSIKAYYDVNGDGLPDNDGIEDDQTQFTFALSRTATPVPPPVIPPFTETAPSSDEFDLDGDGTPPPGDPGDIDGVNDTFNGLQGGAGYTYEVLITHNDTGCPLVIPTPLLENPFTPAISFTPVDNAGCVTDKFTGQIITLIEFDTDGDGILDDISSSPVPADYNFQFEWKDALGNILNDDSGTPVDNYIIGDPTNIPASPLGPGLNNGTYSVTITELNSGCSFTPPDITISPGQFQILYELVATPSTNCRPDGTLDGSLSIKAYYDVNGDGLPDNDGIEDDQTQFTFALSRTATPVPPPVIPPFTETAPSSDEFDLDGDGTPPPGDPGDIDGVNDTFNGLQGGAGYTYEVLITHNDTGCPLVIPTPLLENPFTPAISFTPVDNAGCVTDKFTGQIITLIEFDTDGDGILDDISSSPVPADYNFQFEWKDALGNILNDDSGTPVDNYIIGDPTNIPASPLGPGLNNGTYSVTITELNSGCSFTPPDITISPGQFQILYELVATPSTNCRPDGTLDGSLSIKAYYDVNGDGLPDNDGIEDDQTQFTFALSRTATPVPPPVIPPFTETAPSSDEFDLDGDGTPPPGDPGDIDGVNDTFNGLQGGAGYTYEVLITHNDTGCPLVIPTPLLENPFTPAISFTPVDNAGCVTDKFTGQIITLIEFDTDGDGILDDISSSPVPADYNFQFEWKDALGNILNDDSGTPVDNYIIGDPTNIPASPLGPGLNNGTYSVTITELNSGCSFTPPDITISPGQFQILYELVATPSTNCRPDGTLDGSLSIKAYYDVNGDGLPDNDGIEDDQTQFTFALSRTATPVPPPVIPPFTETAPSSDEFDLDGDGTPPPGDPGDIDGVNDTFNGLQGGAGYTYEVLITHNDTGCPLVIPTPLLENPFTPAISFTQIENVGCEAGLFTGQISALIEFDTDGDGILDDISSSPVPAEYNFQFEWKDALGNILNDDSGTPVDNYIIGDPTNTPASPLGPGLNNGTYSVTITELNSGCSFTPPDITIDNDEQPIIISFQNTRNSSCATPNGELIAGVEIGGVPEFDAIDLTDYEFRWYQGTGINAPSVEILGPTVNFNEVTQLTGNDFYTVRVRNKLTGCENTFTEEVKKVTHKPIISITVTDYKFNISCNENNVQLEAVIGNQFDADLDVPPVDLFIPNTDDDFEYTWYDGPDDSFPIIVSGTFNNSGPPFSNKILYNKAGLDQAFTTPANKLTVGDYTLKVKHIDSQCESDIIFEKIEEPPILFDIIPNLVLPASDCDLKEGKIWVDVVANPSGYAGPNAPPNLQYDWYVGAPTNTVPVKYAAFVPTPPVPPGAYNITTSVPTNSFYTDTEIQFGDQIGVTPGVTEQFPGEDWELLGNPESSLSGVEAGIYTVVVTDIPTGCKEYITIEVPLQIAQQNNVVTVTHNTTCDLSNPNGEIRVNVQPDGVALFDPSDYDIYLFDGTNPTLITGTPPLAGTYRDMQIGADPINTGNDFLPLEPGVYTIASIPNNGPNGCWSAPSTVTISQYAFDPSFTALEFLPNTSCDPGTPDGELLIDISHNPSELPDPPPTTYQVFAARAATPLINEYESLPGLGTGPHEISAATNQLGLVGLDADEYIVKVVSDRDCETERNYIIEKRDIRPSVTDILDDDQFICSQTSSDFGFAQVNEIQYQQRDGTTVTLSYGGTDFDDYVFTWYLDDEVNPTSFDILTDTELSLASGIGDASALLDFNDAEYVGAGTYWVIVKNDDPALEGLECESQPFQFIIEDKSAKPTAVSKVVANTACDEDFADGVIWIDPDRGPIEVGAPPFLATDVWTIDFTEVPTAYGTTLPAWVNPIAAAGETSIFHIQDVVDGTYKYEITDPSTGCPSDEFEIIVGNPITNPSIADYTQLPQFICSPEDGTITITAITTTQSGEISNDAAGTILPIDPAANDALGSPNDYEFTWYFDNPITLVRDQITNPTAGQNSISPATVFTLPAGTPHEMKSGTYWVEFTKIAAGSGLTGGVGCPNSPLIPVSIDVQDKKVKPTAVSKVVANTACDEDFADGVIWIDPDRGPIEVGAPPFLATDVWTIDFTEVPAAYGTTLPAWVNPIAAAGETSIFHIQDVVDGTYKYEITDPSTGCPSDEFEIIVGNPITNPSIADYTQLPQFICSPEDGTITITAITTTQSGEISNDAAGTILPIDPAANDALGSPNDYEFTWYFDNPITLVRDQITNPTAGQNSISPATVFTLPAGTPHEMKSGTYWVEFTKIAAGSGLTGGVGCPNSPLIPVSIDVQDKKVKPTAVSKVVANTACDEDFADGVIWIDPDRGPIEVGAPPFLATDVWTIDFTEVPTAYGTTLPAWVNPIAAAGETSIFHIQDVVDGTYKYEITDPSTGCPSDEFEIIVGNPITNPSIADYTQLPQFICSPEDGTITITAITTTQSGEISNDAAGTILPIDPAANDALGSPNDYEFTWYFDNPITLVRDQITNPTAGQNSISPATVFTLPAGTPHEMKSGTYWVEFTKIAAGSGLTGGVGCPNSPLIPVSIDVQDKKVKPTAVSKVVANTACDEDFADGVIWIDPDRGPIEVGAPPFLATDVWTIDFTEVPTAYGTTLPAWVNPIAAAGETSIFHIQDVVDGTYKYEITDPSTGCPSDEFEIIVGNPITNPSIADYTQLPQFICSPEDGTITITAITTTQSGEISNDAAGTILPIDPAANDALGSPNDYEFTWYFDNPITLVRDQITNPTAGQNSISPATVFTLPAGTPHEMKSGTYWVEFTKIAAGSGLTGGVGCPNSPLIPVSIDVQDKKVKPTAVSKVVANTACDEDFADGVIWIDPDRGPIEVGAPPFLATDVWTIDFTEVPTAYGTTLPAWVNPIAAAGETSIFHIQDVVDGTYKYEITDPSTGCPSDEFEIIVGNPITNPSIADYTQLPQFICSPEDGTITITAITTTQSGEISNDAAGTILPIDPAANDALGSPNDYEFTWYFDNPITLVRDQITNPTAGQNSISPATVFTLPAGTPHEMKSGTYWVEFTKIAAGSGLTGGVGCPNSPLIPVSIDVQDKKVKPTAVSKVVANTACDEDFADGVIWIDPDRGPVEVGAPPFLATDVWTIDFTEVPTAYGTTLPAWVNPIAAAGETSIFHIQDVVDGTYKYEITDPSTGCPSDEFEIIVGNPITNPTIANYTQLPQFICGDDGTITITAITTTQSGEISNDAAGSITPINPAANDALAAPNDYEFTWYFDNPITLVRDQITNPTTGLNSITSDIAGPPTAFINGHTMKSGTYWVEFTKIDNVSGITGGVGCPNSPLIPVSIDVQDEKVRPAFTFETTANTSCDPTGADGSFYIDPDRNGASGANYGVFTDWSLSFTKVSDEYVNQGIPSPIPLNTPLLPDIGAGQTGIYTFSNMLDGIYEFTLIDPGTNCPVNGQLEVPKLEIFPYLDQSGYDITKQLTCNPDGSITINAIESIQSGSPAPVFTPATVSTDTDMSEYLFIWYRGIDFTTATPISFAAQPPLTPIPGGIDPAVDGNFLNINTYPDIGEDTYWVVFTKTTAGGIQCESSPEKFIIESDIALPLIAFTQSSSTSCAPVAPNGQLEAVITTRGLTPVGGLDFTWYVGDEITDPPFVDPTNGTIDASVAGQETLVDVAPGIYTLTVEDVATGCFTTSSFEVLELPVIPNISLDNVTVNPQDICLPSGSILIADADVSIGGNPGFVKDFFFSWSLDTPSGNPLDSISALDGTSTGLPIQGPLLDPSIYANMGAGDYYVSIAPKVGEGAGCPGPPRKVTVDDISTDPQIEFTSTPNSACPGGTPNGIIIATVQEEDGTNTDPYIYTWNVDGNPVDPLNITDNADTSTVINALDGEYSLLVENPNTGCSFTKGFILILDQTLSEPNIILVDKIDPVDCNPTARMEVIEIQLGGQPANVGDFEYRWYQGTFDPSSIIRTDPTDPTSAPISSPNLENVAVGTYFVTAIELNTNCESIAKEVNILDDNIVFPQVEIFLDKPQTSCDVNNPNGQLSALADRQFDDNNSGGLYSFTWFDEFSVQISDSSTVTDLGVGIYTVEVINNTTNCTSTNSFIVEDGTELFRLQISTSSEPVTFCNIDNGIVAAGIANHDIGNWQFTWTGPNGFSTVETGNDSRLLNVEPGEYTVSAIDLSEEYCPSLVKSVTVEDERITPPIDMVVNSQLTNCYVDNPDGQITATAGGSVIGYDFNWYSGTSPSGSVIATNNIISGQPVGSYAVEIIDWFTKCAVSDFRNIEDATVLPPAPGATVLSNLTDCLNPDGAVETVYEGDLTDFDFFWYDGNSASGTPANLETTYSDLDLGEYTTTVMDLTTGCISEGFTVTIEDERVYPEFTTEVTNANCETSNGIIELKFDGDFRVRDVIWYDQSGLNVGAGQVLRDQPTGDYTFDVITFKNCEASGAETIGTEITNYNGISANNDGSNDGFQIDCITLFPNNNVKIFNRAGVLIYEENGYNNDDVIFDGIGLNGIYLAGEDLPDGTYFYIIDKGDGSRPVTGYLELIR